MSAEDAPTQHEHEEPGEEPPETDPTEGEPRSDLEEILAEHDLDAEDEQEVRAWIAERQDRLDAIREALDDDEGTEDEGEEPDEGERTITDALRDWLEGSS